MAHETTDRAGAIEDFAAVLSELREAVGRPSFRVMAGRSRAISHTTLHEAAQGNRLPSWSTTVEFVKACGADPADFRERWERANAAVLAGCAESCPDAGPPPAAVSPGAEEVGPPPDGERAVQERRRRRRGWYAAVAVAAVALLATGVSAVWSAVRHPARTPVATSGASTGPSLSASDCPVHQQNPPSASPQHEGDRAAFVADLTLPDCSHVPRGQTVTKTWRFKNAGTVPWSGYALHRVDLPETRDQCQTIADVPIADTAPGQLVDVKVAVTTPTTAAFCFVRFKMIDAHGKVAFPGSRPVNFQVVVD